MYLDGSITSFHDVEFIIIDKQNELFVQQVKCRSVWLWQPRRYLLCKLKKSLSLAFILSIVSDKHSRLPISSKTLFSNLTLSFLKNVQETLFLICIDISIIHKFLLFYSI